MSTHFKLKFDDLTRRISFPNKPSWKELSHKVSTLYSIPKDLVGVTYIDPEDEEITLNTEEELQDYYQSSYLPGEPIKFTVRNLSLRDRRSESSNIRNTFGQFVDVDIPGVDEWQPVNIPPLDEILGLATPASQVRSAFVESVNEDSVTPKGGEQSLLDRDDGDMVGLISELRILSEDKGKGRATSALSFSSTRSDLAEDNGDKPPVHVYDVSSQNQNQNNLSNGTPHFAPIVAESTPRAQPKDLNDANLPIPVQESKPHEFDDPPLPTLDSASHPEPASASLARDVASFLNMLTGIVSSHPELSESLRAIVRNTTNGTYWTAHREALSQAAAEIQRSTESVAEEGRRMVEEDAGRRVAEALAGVLRIFSQTSPMVQGFQPPPHPPPPPQTSDANDANSRTQTPPMPGGFPSHFPPSFGRNFPFNRRHTWRAPSSMPHNLATGWWPMPPGPPPFGPGIFNSMGPYAARAPHAPDAPAATTAPDPAPVPPAPPLNTEISTGNQSDGALSPQELKTKVEEAKKAYKAEKERYRQQREERRKDKERTIRRGDSLNAPQAPDASTSRDTSHIVSNARNGFPQFEMVNVSEQPPQRHNTHLGHFPRRHEKSAGDLFTRAVNRISRRLSDMGFTDQAYPDLPDKIKAELPTDGAVTKDREDDIVTTLLEGMLAAPKTPAASGSGLKDKDIPGGWH